MPFVNLDTHVIHPCFLFTFSKHENGLLSILRFHIVIPIYYTFLKQTFFLLLEKKEPLDLVICKPRIFTRFSNLFIKSQSLCLLELTGNLPFQCAQVYSFGLVD